MRSLEIWLASYLRHSLRRRPHRPTSARPTHVLFCFVDHFEPVSARGSTVERERARMRAWTERHPELASRHGDSDGVPPQHSWFYPAEDYRAEYLDDLARLCDRGLGEIELHLHHGNDTAESLRGRLEKALVDFHRHGALITRGEPSASTYGFIHGNLALANSMRDPSLCGVNEELEVLRSTGCYADFSMPTAPAKSQTRKVNSIYYAVADRHAPKSHDRGTDAEVGTVDRPGLLLIQGPLALNFRERKLGLLPRIDNGEITGRFPGTRTRIRRWVRQNVHVKGRPDWVVVKVSCHGAEEQHFDALLGAGADALYGELESLYRDRDQYRLHYVTARELYNIVKAAEAGREGDPGEFRDFAIHEYQNRPAARTDRGRRHAQ